MIGRDHVSPTCNFQMPRPRNFILRRSSQWIDITIASDTETDKGVSPKADFVATMFCKRHRQSYQAGIKVTSFRHQWEFLAEIGSFEIK